MQKNWGSEKRSNLPKIAQLAIIGVRIQLVEGFGIKSGALLLYHNRTCWILPFLLELRLKVYLPKHYLPGSVILRLSHPSDSQPDLWNHKLLSPALSFWVGPWQDLRLCISNKLSGMLLLVVWWPHCENHRVMSEVCFPFFFSLEASLASSSSLAPPTFQGPRSAECTAWLPQAS